MINTCPLIGDGALLEFSDLDGLSPGVENAAPELGAEDSFAGVDVGPFQVEVAFVGNSGGWSR